MPKPRDDHDSQRVLDAVRRIVRALRLSAREAEARVGLTAAQLFVLQRLAAAERLSIGELAARTYTDPSSVSVVVRRLVARELVTRSRAESDERRLEIAITKQGRALLRSAPDVAQERLVGALDALPVARRRTLARLLEEVVGSMKLESDAAPMFFEDEAKREGARPIQLAEKRRSRRVER